MHHDYVYYTCVCVKFTFEHIGINSLRSSTWLIFFFNGGFNGKIVQLTVDFPLPRLITGGYISIYIYIWVNYNDQTLFSLTGILVNKGNHPQMAELFRLVNYYKCLPIKDISQYIYIYISYITRSYIHDTSLKEIYLIDLHDICIACTGPVLSLSDIS